MKTHSILDWFELEEEFYTNINERGQISNDFIFGLLKIIHSQNAQIIYMQQELKKLKETAERDRSDQWHYIEEIQKMIDPFISCGKIHYPTSVHTTHKNTASKSSLWVGLTGGKDRQLFEGEKDNGYR